MSSKPSRAMRLSKKHTLEELQAMENEVRNDPDSQANGTNRPYRLTPQAMKLVDDIGWAMYIIRTDGKGNARMATPPVEPGRNW